MAWRKFKVNGIRSHIEKVYSKKTVLYYFLSSETKLELIFVLFFSQTIGVHEVFFSYLIWISQQINHSLARSFGQRFSCYLFTCERVLEPLFISFIANVCLVRKKFKYLPIKTILNVKREIIVLLFNMYLRIYNIQNVHKGERIRLGIIATSFTHFSSFFVIKSMEIVKCLVVFT